MGFDKVQLPSLLVHGFWNSKGEKMSKSLGNSVAPLDLIETVGTDAVRYYLARDIATGKDSDFDPDRLLVLFNSEMANGLGNLLNRTLKITKQLEESPFDNEDCQMVRNSFEKTLATYRELMPQADLRGTLEALAAFISDVNTFAERLKPWELRKDESKVAEFNSAVGHMAESCVLTALLLSPFLPSSCEKILTQLKAEHLKDLPLSDLKWGLLENGHQVGKGKPVFPRLQKLEITEESPK